MGALIEGRAVSRSGHLIRARQGEILEPGKGGKMHKLWSLAVGALVAGMAAVPVAASPPMPSSGTFSLLTATVTDTRTADGNTFLVIERTAALTGTYTGTSTDEVRIVIHQDGSANITGAGVCVCTVDGRSGTAEYRFSGRGTFPAILDGHYVIGHGTGGLEGLHAEGPFSGSFFAVSYGGQHHFDPA